MASAAVLSCRDYGGEYFLSISGQSCFVRRYVICPHLPFFLFSWLGPLCLVIFLCHDIWMVCDHVHRAREKKKAIGGHERYSRNEIRPLNTRPEKHLRDVTLPHAIFVGRSVLNDDADLWKSIALVHSAVTRTSLASQASPVLRTSK